MARRTKEEAEQTRKQLIEAAIVVFDRKCYSKTTMQDIAEEAGVTRGAIYWHFKSKAEIFYEINLLLAERMEEMLTEVESSNDRIIERLHQETCNLLITTSQDKRQNSIYNVIFDRTEYSDEVIDSQEFKNSKRREFVDRIEALMHAAQRNGEIRPDINVRELAIAFWSIFSGIYIFWVSDQEAFSIIQSTNNLLTLFFDGIKK